MSIHSLSWFRFTIRLRAGIRSVLKGIRSVLKDKATGSSTVTVRVPHHHVRSRAFPVRSRASGCASSSPVSSKSEIRVFSAILSRWVDLESAETPRCMHQRSSTWAGGRLAWAAMAPTTGSQRAAEREGIEVHLVDRRRHDRGRRHSVQLSGTESRDADRAGVSELTGAFRPHVDLMPGDDAGFLVGAGGLEVVVPLQELVAVGHISGLPADSCVVGTLLIERCRCNTLASQTRRAHRSERT
jgi:hypothetical protein